MMQIFRIYLKQLLPHFFIILLIVCGQLVMGQMNQQFVSSKTPPTALEVYVEKESPQTNLLVEKLNKTPEIKVQ